MSLLPRLKEFAGYFALGFISDVSATRFCLEVSQRHILASVGCNLVLMVANIYLIRKAKDMPCVAFWIMGQSLGIWLALAIG
jgi:hypothetical protein